MRTLLVLAGAGALGTLARYGTATAAVQVLGARPGGTWAVNILGSFLFGILFAVMEFRWQVSETLKLAVFTGFMGAFTTFSTLAFESADMLRERQYGLLAVHLGGQAVVGVVAVLLGLGLAARVAGARAL